MKILLFISIAFIFLITNALSQENALIKTFKTHEDAVLDACFSPNEGFYLSSSTDKAIHLVDIESGKVIQKFEKHYRDVNSIEFLDSNRFISGGDINVNIWNLNGEIEKNFIGHNTLIWHVAVSPDKKLAFSGSYDRIARLWDLESGKLVYENRGHDKNILATCFSLDGKSAFTASRDTKIKQWSLSSNELIHTYYGHSDNIYALKMHPNGKTFASVSKDKMVHYWEIGKDEPIYSFEGHKIAVKDLAFSPNGKFLATCSYDGEIILWEVSTAKIMYVYKGHEGAVNSINFNVNGDQIISSSTDKTVKIWALSHEILVDFYFDDEVKTELATKEELFKPKQKGESRKDYQLRLEEAKTFKKEVYNKYYELYKSKKL